MTETPDVQRPSRTGMEIGLVITVGAFLLGLSFNAGIQYSKIMQLDSRTISLQSDIASMQASQTPELERLARIEVLLQTMQAEQTRARHELERAGITQKRHDGQ